MPARVKKTTINLLLDTISQKSFHEQLLTWTITYGRYIIILTQITVLTVFFARFKLDRDYADLKESITQKQVLVESVSDIESEILRIQSKLTNIADATKNQNVQLDILRKLQELSPSDIRYSQLTVELQKVRFTAATVTLKSFNVLLSNIQKTPVFSDITIEDIQRRKDGRLEFRIQMSIVENQLAQL